MDIWIICTWLKAESLGSSVDQKAGFPLNFPTTESAVEPLVFEKTFLTLALTADLVEGLGAAAIAGAGLDEGVPILSLNEELGA